MHTDEELKDMAEHVVYEIKAFLSAIRALTVLKKTDEAWNRTLESALLHFRILRGFFIDEPRGNDVSAREYVAAWVPTPDKIFVDTKTALDKRLAHLTWDRVPWSSGDWGIAAMEAAVERVFEEFKKALTKPRSEWFSLFRMTKTRGFGDSDGYSTISGTLRR